ncbi:MAG: hypothetical protein Ct9H300mP12_02400 [Acidimicrobiales bacterium]|nr:MAG: hypothetical protein Ct9H300mP12_02400 [Acidimicrobiales bacterium]
MVSPWGGGHVLTRRGGLGSSVGSGGSNRRCGDRRPGRDRRRSRNVAPVAIYVAFWVGVPLLVVLAGPWWSTVSPLGDLFRLVDRVRTGRSAGSWGVPAPVGDGWLAVVPVAAFLWLELAYHDGARPRSWAGRRLATRWCSGASPSVGEPGRPAALRDSGCCSGCWPDSRRSVGPRGPSSGAAASTGRATADDLRPSEVTLLLVVLGGTAFDGVSRTRFWADVSAGYVGWGGTGVGTLGLIWWWPWSGGLAPGVTAGRSPDWWNGVLGAFRAFATPHRARLPRGPLLLLAGSRGPTFWIRASDPYGRGGDLFGTAGDSVDWTRVSPGTVGWVQLGAIVAGHPGGVFLAHDRSIESWRPSVALRSQYPLLVVMVAYTVAGLVLMTG